MTSADIHRQLSCRTKKSEESFQQYLLIMKEMGAHGNVKEDAIMDYIIAGLPDTEVNKAILYGATTLKELKTKLELYAKMKARMQVDDISRINYNSTTSHGPTKASGRYDNNRTSSISIGMNKCFNCGVSGHVAKSCPDLVKGFKCFKCHLFGHKAPDCQSKLSANTSKEQVVDKKSTAVYQLNIGLGEQRI